MDCGNGNPCAANQGNRNMVLTAVIVVMIESVDKPRLRNSVTPIT
jgi:hypothetical protein